MNNKLNTLFIAILLFVFVSCKNDKKENEEGSANLTKVTVGVHSWPGGGMVYVGDAKGYFKEEGIELVVKKIENFDTKRASLISGEIDIDVANTMDQLVIYNENDFPAQIIAVSDESIGGDGLVGKNSIATLKDLEGKTIAFAEASPSDFFLRYILFKGGIDIAKIKLKPVADSQIAGNAVIAGQVDAAVTYEPWLSQASKVEGLKLIASTKTYPTLIPGLLIVDEARLNKNKEVYTKFLRAWFKSVDYYNANREDASLIISKGMGMELTEVKDILSVVAIASLDDNKKHFDKTQTDNLYELVSKISSFWKENKFITKIGDPEKMINPSIASQVK